MHVIEFQCREEARNSQGNKNLYCLLYTFREGQTVWARIFLGTLGWIKLKRLGNLVEEMGYASLAVKIFFLNCCYFLLFRATPAACRSSQARGQIRSCSCQRIPQPQQRRIWATSTNLGHSSRQCQILNPLSEARDGTQILMDTSLVCNQLSHDSNSPRCKDLVMASNPPVLVFSKEES